MAVKYLTSLAFGLAFGESLIWPWAGIAEIAIKPARRSRGARMGSSLEVSWSYKSGPAGGESFLARLPNQRQKRRPHRGGLLQSIGSSEPYAWVRNPCHRQGRARRWPPERTAPSIPRPWLSSSPAERRWKQRPATLHEPPWPDR